ncbi:unnamed protein product, partial [Prorocentrum cordatum]
PAGLGLGRATPSATTSGSRASPRRARPTTWPRSGRSRPSRRRGRRQGPPRRWRRRPRQPRCWATPPARPRPI